MPRTFLLVVVIGILGCGPRAAQVEEIVDSRPLDTRPEREASVAAAPAIVKEIVTGPNADAQRAQTPSIDELLLFFPSKHPAGDWAPQELRYDDVWFASEDGTRLHGWYCPCENARATILIAHGNAGHIASRALWLAYLQKTARVATFMFDYRGYGRSEGFPTVAGVLLDAKAARAKLRELARIEDSEMVLMGESLGGAVAVQLAAESPPRGLILQSTFASLRETANFHSPRLSWMVPASKLDSRAQIARYQGPLLQSHGTADAVIPFSHGEDLFRAANEPKTFVEVPGADHTNWASEEYLARLDEFLTRLAVE
jgi:fermentation-respiration switch protein FrsA (DUF1100 family)